MKSKEPETLATVGLDALRMMALIRGFEQRLEGYAQEGLIRGSTHPSVGMEGVAVGVSLALEPQDSVVSNHRGHAHCLARGADPRLMLAEIMGREDGYCAGKGGSMHIAVRDLGILGTNGVVGAGIGLATGAALAAVLRSTEEVAVVFFGDGATNQGILAESMNLAAIWGLPVVFICENNHYAQSSSIEQMAGNPHLSRRGEALGVRSFDVDGMDVIAVYECAREVTQYARSGGGPSFVVADTYRYLGHMAGDTEIYREAHEIDEWKEKDPIERLSQRLIEGGFLSEDGRARLTEDVVEIVEEAERFARASSFPSVETAFKHVYAEDGLER